MPKPMPAREALWLRARTKRWHAAALEPGTGGAVRSDGGGGSGGARWSNGFLRAAWPVGDLGTSETTLRGESGPGGDMAITRPSAARQVRMEGFRAAHFRSLVVKRFSQVRI